MPNDDNADNDFDTFRLRLAIGDDYEIEKKFGEGGMGNVYLVRHRYMGVKRAVKLLKAELLSEPVNAERFKQEAKILAALNDAPNVVQIFDAGIKAEVCYLVMEYVEGQDIAALLERGAFSLEKSVKITIQVARALAYISSKGITHRDLKPANVLLGKDDQVKVTDFGISKPTSSNVNGIHITVPHTAVDSVPCSVDYASPEQLQGKICDVRSDLYSLGVIFFEMLAGSAPFKGGNDFEVALKHLNSPPPDLRLVAPHVPGRYVEVVERLLKKNQDERFQSAEELIASLEREGPPPPPPIDVIFDWRAYVIAAACCVFVLLTGLGAYLWFHRLPKPKETHASVQQNQSPVMPGKSSPVASLSAPETHLPGPQDGSMGLKHPARSADKSSQTAGASYKSKDVLNLKEAKFKASAQKATEPATSAKSAQDEILSHEIPQSKGDGTVPLQDAAAAKQVLPPKEIIAASAPLSLPATPLSQDACAPGGSGSMIFRGKLGTHELLVVDPYLADARITGTLFPLCPVHISTNPSVPKIQIISNTDLSNRNRRLVLQNTSNKTIEQIEIHWVTTSSAGGQP